MNREANLESALFFETKSALLGHAEHTIKSCGVVIVEFSDNSYSVMNDNAIALFDRRDLHLITLKLNRKS